jgi:hypothetical protein
LRSKSFIRFITVIRDIDLKNDTLMTTSSGRDKGSVLDRHFVARPSNREQCSIMEPGRTSTASLIGCALFGACRITILVACLQNVTIDGREMRATDFPAATMASALDAPVASVAPNARLLDASALPRRASAAGFTNRPNSPSNGRWLHPSLDAAET